MATQQDVIKAFMRSLDNTTLSGADALDEAIRNSSGGRFSDMQDLIDSFISDVQNYGGNYTYYDSQTEKFLKDYCGIILGNDDTGAISGSDAGGTVTKTAESIVVESGSLLSYPSGGSTTINGLTFHWPDRSSLGSDEQAVADRIYSWWAKGALELIQESFGLNFMEAGTSVKEISIEFYTNANESILASVNHRYSSYTGKATRLTLSVNMYYYAGFNRQDVNGAASNTSFYLDRTLAHEFVHAVMAANIDHFHNLPKFVKEGLAELVHGIDDERTSRIRKLATNSMVDYLKSMFTIRGTYYDCGSDSYAGGYMLFRYLAKQAANSDVVELPSGVYYNADKTAVTIVAPFVGIWDALDYAYTVQLVDASQETNNITIKAGSNDSTIKAGLNGSDIYGQGGDDTIYGGAGKDVIWYGTGDGADIIYDFQSGTDVLHFYNSAQLDSVATSGTDVLLTVGNGSVKLVGMTNQRVDITDAGGNNAAYYFGRQGADNIFTYEAGSHYYGSLIHTDRLKINSAATVSLADTELYHNIDIVDATGSNEAVNLTGGARHTVLYGGTQNDTLTAGPGDAALLGGPGDDIYYGSSGIDAFWWGAYPGNDVVYGYESGKDVISFEEGELESGTVVGNDVVLTSNTGSVITIKDARGKVIVMENADGTITTQKVYDLTGVTYNYDKTAVTIEDPFEGTWDAQDYASTVRTVDASQATNSITIKAGEYNNIIKAGVNGTNIYGQGGNDIIYGGAGKDVFWYGNGDGHDVICDFQSSTDILCFYDTAQLDSVTTDGTNVILKSGNGSVTLTDRTNKRIYITDTDGKNMGYYFGRQDKANTFVYAANRIYYGSVGYRDTLQVNKGATVSLANTTLYHDIDILDARKSKKAVKLYGGTQASKLYGSAQNDKLTAGSGGASLIGGKGNDTLYGGAGTDKFYWGSGWGDDVVYNYEISKDIIAFSSGSLKSGKVSGSDVILTSSGGNTIKIKNAANKEIVVANTKGTQTRKTYLSPGVTYNTAKTKAIIKAPYSGTWDAAKFADSIRTIDASKETNKITIKAGNYNNTIKAGGNGSNIYGQGGNDKIYGGAKKDVIWYGTGDGTDTIYNFQSGTDVLRFYNEAQIDSVTTSGTSVVLKSGTGSVKLVGMTNQRVDITDNAGKNTIYYFGRQDKANTFVYAANRSYYGSTKYKDTLQINTGATVSLANKTLYHDIDTLDARNSKKAVKLTGGTKASKLYGSAKSDKLVAGSGGASLIGGMGNDTLYGGKGKDKFYWGANLGNDKIYNYTSGKDILVFSEGSLESGMVSGQDVVLTSNTGNTVTIKKAAGKAITIQGTDGVKVEKIYNVPTTDTSLPAGVTYDSNTLTVKISNGTIDSFSLEGNDVIFKSTVGDIRIADGKDKILSVVDGDGVKATYKVAGNIPTGTEAAYNDGNTEVILGENTYIKYIFDINEDVQTVRTGNATASKKDHCILWGSIHDDVLIAGSGEMELYGSFGNDTLYGGSGKNDFGWSRSFGNDVVYNYTTGQDRIKLESNRIESYTVSGNDVILKSGNATLTVKDVKPGDITVYNDFSDQYDTYWYDGKLPDGVTYDSAKNQYILSSFFGNRNYLVDMASLPDLTASLDATAVNSSHFSIYGDERDNTIIASRGGGYIQTGSGCDTVYFGDGRDSLGWGHFYGAEITVYGYKKGQDAIELGYGDTVTRYEINGNDLVMWNEGSYWKSKLTLKDTQLSDVTVLDSYGKEVTAWQQNAALLETSTSACAVTTEETLANGNESLAVAEEKKECLVTLKEAGISEDMGSVSADTTSLYLDDDKTYVDHDSMLMESVSQNQADLAAQKLAQDMVAYSNEMNSDAAGTLLAGNVVTTQGLAPVGENGPLYAGSVKKDDFLSSK
ncbi:hypothetical protein [Selenomonas sp. KH1T6]|uniref:hypothetical protein n=1 Tax=Selenomonas sp. KH1T6 TaxID=3158784 RepID=UPI0008A72A30|nr:Ca2+-binding protein, RTX toxin-related [Selenomonas ruminantium]